MHPLTRTALSLGTGLLVGADLPGSNLCWAAIAMGLLLLALPLGGMAGWRGGLLAFVVGVGCARTVPMGPELTGSVRIVGVRVGGGVGRSGDVDIGRWQPGASREGDWRAGTGRVRVIFPEDAPPPGVPVLLFGKAGPLHRALPGAPDPVRAARLAGIRTLVRAERAVRLDGESQALIEAERDPTGLLRAIVLGDRSGCTQETLSILRRTGTSHLLSISGFHVGVAAAMVMAATSLLTKLVAIVRPQGLHTPLPLLAGLAGAWSYTALAGWVVPAERAAVMLTVALLARSVRRGVEAVPALALVGVGLGIAEPGAPATASFQLSFGAMAGLVLFVPPLTARLPPGLPWPLKWAADALITTLGATLGTLPVAAWWFQELPPLSPLANLVSMPVLGVALVPLGAVVCAAPDPLSAWAAWLGTVACQLELAVLSVLAVEPLRPAVGPAGALLLGGVVVLSLKRPLPALLLGLTLLTWPRWPPAELRLTVLDVGQGDAMLLEHSDGRRILVDGGRPGPGVAQWLRRQGIRSLDAAVATHPDLDHTGGLLSVLDTLEVGTLWARHPPPALLEVARQRGIPVRDPTAEPGLEGLLHPLRAEELSDNDGSLVLGVGPFLLTGDVERAGEALLVQRLSEGAGPFRVLKLAHHGSATSTTDALLEAVRPSLAVISVGPNPYGHPHPAVLQRLASRGISVLRTDRDGTLTFEVQGERVVVRTAAGRRGELSLGPP